MDWSKIIKTAQKAVDLYKEADELVATVKEAVASSTEAMSTTDQDRLNELLREATDRRQAASADLDAALAELAQRK